MQFINKYINTFPEDDVVLIGGAAAALIIKSCVNKNLPIKDIDVHINTKSSGEQILDKWMSILPTSYSPLYCKDEPLELLTFIDASSQNLNLDIFINQREISSLQEINGIFVENTSNILSCLEAELDERRYEIKYINNSKPDDKLLRLEERYKLLKECLM